MSATAPILVNRAPVLTLWAAVVAERLGFDRDEALTLGRAVAGLTAHAKGVRLGIYEPSAEDARERRQRLADGEALHVELLGRAVPAVATPGGIRATAKGEPTDPASVERYLRAKLGDRLDEVRATMERVAASYPPAELARIAFRLYERFRPEVPPDEAGWGKAGALDLARIARCARG